MARIPFIETQVGAAGPVDVAQQRPNQAFANLERNADRAGSLLDQLADRDAALDGAAVLADFRASRSKRLTELRTNTKTPETFTDEALGDFDGASEQLLAGQKNERVQAFLQSRLAEMRAGEEADNDQWAAGVMIDRAQVKAVDTVNRFSNAVQSNPGQFQQALADVEAMIETAGLPLPNADKVRAVAKSSLARSAVYGQIETNPGGVLQQLNGGKWDAYLDSDAKISAVNAAQSEIKRRESEARANAAQARAEALFDIQTWARDNEASIAATGKPVPSPYTPDQLKGILKPQQYEAVMKSHADAASLFQAVGDMRTQTPAEMQATIDKLAPQGGEEGYADKARIYQTAVKLRDEALTARNRDPGAAARAAFPNVADAWEQVSRNPTDPGHLRLAIKRTLAAQEALGIPADRRKPLPAQFAQAVAGEIRSAPSDQAAAKLSEYQAMFGANWKTVYAQLAPNLDPNTAWAGTLDNKNMAAILLETSRMAGADGKAGSGVPALRKALGVQPSGAESISQIVSEDGDVRDLMTAMSRRGGGGAVSISIDKAAETLALGLMQRNGISKEAATEQAIKALVRDKYNFGRVNGLPFVTPKAVDADVAERGARAAMARIDGEGLDLPLPDPGAVEADTRSQYLSAVKRNGYWVTMPGNTGLELWAGDAPVTRRGQRIRMTWDALSSRAGDLTAQGRIEQNLDRYDKIFGKVGE